MHLRCAAILVGVSVLLAACVPQSKRTLDDSARHTPDGRDVLVIVAQGEIRANIMQSNVAGAMGGGLIPALMDAMANQNRTSAAQDFVRPIREGLSTYDFDQRALQATQAVTARIAWLNARNTDLTKDGSKEKVLDRLNQTASSQLMVARYGYAMSHDFTELSISLELAIYPKTTAAGTPPEARVNAENAVYRQQFHYAEKLPEISSDQSRNIFLWSGDNAKRAREALDAGLSMVAGLSERSLLQTPAAAEALDKGPSISIGGFRGSLVETSERGTLLYNSLSGRWVFVSGLKAPQS